MISVIFLYTHFKESMKSLYKGHKIEEHNLRWGLNSARYNLMAISVFLLLKSGRNSKVAGSNIVNLFVSAGDQSQHAHLDLLHSRDGHESQIISFDARLIKDSKLITMFFSMF